MRVVITGAAGFIGSRLAEIVLDDAERLGYDDVVFTGPCWKLALA